MKLEQEYYQLKTDDGNRLVSPTSNYSNGRMSSLANKNLIDHKKSNDYIPSAKKFDGVVGSQKIDAKSTSELPPLINRNSIDSVAKTDIGDRNV